jgi:hypothetical protein
VTFGALFFSFSVATFAPVSVGSAQLKLHFRLLATFVGYGAVWRSLLTWILGLNWRPHGDIALELLYFAGPVASILTAISLRLARST